MPSDPANRYNPFLLRLSWSLALTGEILPCSYRLSLARFIVSLFIVSELWYGGCFS